MRSRPFFYPSAAANGRFILRELYLLRHGETLFNRQHKIQGWCDSPLTEDGRAQACAAGRAFAEAGLVFDAFASSTSERASDTLELVMGELGCADRPYARLKGLKEFNHGVFEGEQQYLQPGLEAFESFFKQFGGEDTRTVQERMARALDQVMGADGVRRALVVSHAGAMFNFLLATGGDPRVANPMPNCSCMVFTYDKTPETTCGDVSWEDLAHRFVFQRVLRP